MKTLLSASTLDRKIARSLAPADLAAGMAILSRLDGMPAVTTTAAQLDGLRLGAKLRALYVSGGDLEALARAVDVAMTDHRDLHQLSEDLEGYDPASPDDSGPSRPLSAGGSGLDRFVAWLEQ